MSESAPMDPDWKAPADDGQILLWPRPADLLAQTLANQRRLASSDAVRVQNIPLPQLRRRLRQWVGHQDDSLPLVATGHQIELSHPGVWMKNLIIDAVAKALNGRAVHVAVDTDSPKHLHLRWPGGGGGPTPITDDPNLPTAAWTGLLAAPTPSHLAQVESDLAAAARAWDFVPSTDAIFQSLRRLTLDTPDLAHALTNSLHRLDWELGLRHHALLLSPLLAGEPYLALAHHILARPEQFAHQYNTALAEYRVDHHLRNAARPMPDLAITPDHCETPFWLDDLDAAHRSRLTVTAAGGTGGGRGSWRLDWAGEVFQFDPNREGWTAAAELGRWLAARRLRICPRALTLTMFLRMFLADQFVHGIGGARYDQVSDRLMERHFGLAPPAFAVATATLYFPTVAGQTRICLPNLRHEGHQLRHRFWSSKRDWVAQIFAAPRHSPQRRELFARMHEQMSAAARRDPALAAWEQKFQAARVRAASEESLFDRDLFYALQPRQRLTSLMDRCEKEFAR